jgi:hypothetical protein
VKKSLSYFFGLKRDEVWNHIQFSSVILLLDIFDYVTIAVEWQNQGRHIPEVESEAIKLRDIGMVKTPPNLGFGQDAL